MASKRKPHVRRTIQNTTPPAIMSSAGPARVAVASRPKKMRKDIVPLVRAGVERFILENATMEEFLRTLRLLGEPESVYAHQLTGSVLSRIVKQAISRRKPKRESAGRR